MNIEIKGENISEQEKQAYVMRIKQENPNREIKSLTVEIDGEFVNLTYELELIPFERIRRITGYLVGTTGRWNNAKQAELKDRETHGIQK